MAEKKTDTKSGNTPNKVAFHNLLKVLQTNRRLVLLDVALLATAALMIFTNAMVFFFHVVFLLLTLGAFYWKLRAFVFRAIFWVTVTATVIIIAVNVGETQADELIEIPLLTAVLLLVFAIARHRARAEEALRHERGIMDAITENTQVHLAYLDSQFNFVRVNSAYVQGCGHSREELLGRNHFELFPNTENQAIFEQVRDTGQPVEFHARPFEYADQPERGITYWDWTLVPVASEDDQDMGLVFSLLDVTEPKRAEALLREQNQFILNVFESLRHPFYVVDAHDYTLEMANPATYSGESHEPVTCYALTHRRETPCADEEYSCPLEEIKKTRKPVVVEHIHHDRDGNRKVFEVHGHPIFDPVGKVSQIIEYTLDVTERKRTEEALEESEERYRMLVETMNEGLAVIDENAEMTYVNDEFCEMLGYSRVELIGHKQMEVIDSDNQELQTGKFPRQRKGEYGSYETVLKRKDGGKLAVILSESPLFDRDGNFRGSIGVFTDISERKRVEEALESLARFPSENRNPVMRVSDNGTIRYANQASAHLLAMWATQVSQKLPDRWRQLAADAISSGESHTIEIACEDRIFSLDFAPVEGATYVNLYGRDITDRKRAEEALQERTQELATLLELSRHVALTLELEPLLGLILDRLKDVVDYEGATIYRLEGEVLAPLAHRGPVPQEDMLQLRLSLENSLIWHELLLSQKPVIISDVRDDTPLAQDFREAIGKRLETAYGQIRFWMGVPLTVKDQVMGILTLQHSGPDHQYKPRQVDLVLAFANQAVVAIENNQLYAQAQALAATEERQRLARDLHDAVSQTLFSASLSAEVLPRLWERNRLEGQRCLEEVQLLTRVALAEMRTLLLELRPEALVETDLSDLLGQLTEAIGRRARLAVTLEVEEPSPIPPDVQVALYRISQEALNNVVKHASANQAAVCLRRTPPSQGEQQGLELRISDDGRGFDLACVPPDTLGLGIMAERAEAIGAELRIESQIEHGTHVVVVWPRAR